MGFKTKFLFTQPLCSGSSSWQKLGHVLMGKDVSMPDEINVALIDISVIEKKKSSGGN